MGIARSTFYDTPDVRASDTTVVAEMKTICDEFEAYGYRRVGAELRHRGMVVNAKKIRRLMREHELNPRRRRRFIATTDSNHSYPIFPDLANNMTPDGPNQLWVADITYVAIAIGFVYLAAILDAWSRRVVGYAISRSIDARLAIAALKAAINTRNPALRASFRPWLAIRLRTLSRRFARARPRRVHGSARQSLRQRQG
jgi:putative transposase